MSSDRRHCRARSMVGVILVGIAGCGQPKGVVFEPPDPPLRWPKAPEPARIEYVGQLVVDRDLKPAKSFGQVVGDKLFGEAADRSMLSPYGVCTDGADRLFVSDSNAQVVHVFDLESRLYERWPRDDQGPNLAQPLGIAWDPAGMLLVADGAAGRIVVFNGNGELIDTLGEGELDRPSGVAFDATTGLVFVADPAAHAVVVLDRHRGLRQRLGERGTAPGHFNYPTNVALDRHGNLYVADTLNFRVQVFDNELRPMLQIGSQGDRPGFLSQPKGIAVDGEGHLYVVDAHFEAVQVFDATGQLLLAFGREGRQPGEFWLPTGIHIDGSNRIWIADSYNRRVQVFRFLEEAR